MELKGKAKEMMDYLPQYWQDIEEMKYILHSQGIEFESLTEEVKNILNDAYILTASEKRISQWEKRLKLPPTGTLDERRMAVLRYIAMNSKLSGTLIKSLVASAYNNARAKVDFKDSTINVIVVPLPEHFLDELDFSILEDQLELRKPCHIGLHVERGYSKWGDVKDTIRTWGDVKNDFKNWEGVYLYIPY